MSGDDKKSEQVRIWSGEHCAWWRAGGCGYTKHESEAGLYDRETAHAMTVHCDPSKMIRLDPVATSHEWDSDGERCVKCGAKDWMGGPCSTPSHVTTIAPEERALTDAEICEAWNSAGADRPEAGAVDLYLHYMRAIAKAQRAKMLATPSATLTIDPEVLALAKSLKGKSTRQPVYVTDQLAREIIRLSDGGNDNQGVKK